MGARSYLPAADSFTSRDSYPGSLDTPVSLNRYTYAHDNPLANLDPTGNAAAPNAYTQNWDQYWVTVGANINEYEFYSYLDQQQKVLARGGDSDTVARWWAHYRATVVEPNRKAFYLQAIANWEEAHPLTSMHSSPEGMVPNSPPAGGPGRAAPGKGPYAGRARDEGEFDYAGCGSSRDLPCVGQLSVSIALEIKHGGVSLDCGSITCTIRYSRNLTGMINEFINNYWIQYSEAVVTVALEALAGAIVGALFAGPPGGVLGGAIGAFAGAIQAAVILSFKVGTLMFWSNAADKGACAGLTFSNGSIPLDHPFHPISDNGRLCADGRPGAVF